VYLDGPWVVISAHLTLKLEGHARAVQRKNAAIERRFSTYLEPAYDSEVADEQHCVCA
tara:strand:- start:9642 stop:9815 length:174 start_codon:yes stop_codon:yes gene_type:complete